MAQPHDAPIVKPQVVFVHELINDAAAGKLRIPRFQRRFVWRRQQMLELLDSVSKQYPIGSLLVWETSIPLDSFDVIGHVRVQAPPSGAKRYVLDGHQRLSTLAGLLTERAQPHDDDDDDPPRWTVWYNARDEQFEHPDPGARPEAHHFPLARLMDTVQFIEECQRMLRGGEAEAPNYVSRVQTVARTFQSYKLPVIEIQGSDLNQAVEIFARLNSKGQRMTADQMVSALSYGEQDGRAVRNLATDIDSINEALVDDDFGELDRTIVLRAVLANLDQDVYNTDWTALTRDRRNRIEEGLPDAVERTRRALLLAVAFLRSQGVHNQRLLPYAMQAVVLSAFFDKCPEPPEAARALLRRWFWVTSFTGWFASGNPSRVRALIQEFREKAQSLGLQNLDGVRLDDPALPFPKAFDMRSARVRTWLLALLAQQPRDRDGRLIEEPWRVAVDSDPAPVGYVFAPKASDSEKHSDAASLYSSPANRIVRVTKNRSQAKVWLVEVSDPAVLASHGVPVEALPLLLNDQRVEFLRQRRDHLIELERQFMKAHGVTPPPSDSRPQAAPIDTGD
jgi:hypothetical protein